MASARPSKLKVGIDVPWVTSWTAEEPLGVRPCASVNGALALAQAERPGMGRPIYSQNHLRRQRESIRFMLCPMCGRPTAAGDRWTLLAKPQSAASLKAKGLGFVLPPELTEDHTVMNAGSIAPCHLDCAERSAVLCPHLKADPLVALREFPERWTVAPLLVQATRQLAHFRAQAPTRAPVMAVAFLQLCGIV